MGDQSSPVILLVFANTRNAFLQGIPEETQALQTLLADLDGFEVVNLPYSKPEVLLATLRQYRNRIAVLHFAGHTDSTLWHMDKGSLDATGIAELSRFIPNLKLLFLNGCHNVAQVRLFAKAGIPAIVATSRPIDDQQALQFGTRFYHNLITEQGKTPIVNAFEAAKAEVKALGASQQYRSLDIRNNHATETEWAWALYTTSAQAEQWHLSEAMADPCFTLPPLPPKDLPTHPFRDLYFFREQDAEVFFGRCQQINTLFHALTGTVHASDPVLLLHGRSGVGKSSFLAAGLVPRLKAAGNDVHYLRYDPLLGALGCLQQVLEHDDVVSAWREWENREQKPLIIILDQLEEIFTLQASAETVEQALAEPDEHQQAQTAASSRSQLVILVKALLPLFAADNHDLRPQGKLVLSFRKEWLAEILSICNQYELPNSDYFLKALQRSNIIDAIEGITRQPRLKQKYRLSIKNTADAKLSEIIADDLLADEESNIAPTLQILLSKLWRKVKARSHRCFTLEDYNQLRKDGLLLEDHFEQQLEQIGTLKPWGEEAKNSGLLLDILQAHTTPMGTAQSISVAELQRLYPHIDHLTQLIEALKNRYLLINVFDNETSNLKSRSTRLSHDTLAALVRKRFDNSVLPGQRARRLLDSRKEDWYEHDDEGNLRHDEQGHCLVKKTGPALGRSDLKVAEKGRYGTRVWDAVEKRLIHKSQRRRYLFVGIGAVQIASLVGLVMFAVFYAHHSKGKMQLAQEHERATLSLYLSERALQISQSPGKLRGYQDRALLLALQALQYNTDNQAQKVEQKSGQYGSLSQILYADDRLPPHTFQQDSSFASSANQRFFASFSSDYRLSLWQFDGSHEQAMQVHYSLDIDAPVTIKKLRFSPAARYLVGLSQQGQLIWWRVDSGEQLNHIDHATLETQDMHDASVPIDSANHTISHVIGHDIKQFLFNPSGKHLVSMGQDGGLVWWNNQQGQAIQRTPHFIDNHHVQTIQFNASGKRLVSLDRDGAIVWWDGETGQALQIKPHHIKQHFIERLYFTPKGEQLITLGREGNLLWWDAQTGQPLSKKPLQTANHHVVEVLTSPNRKDNALVTRSREGNVAWWDSATGKRLLLQTKPSHRVAKIAFTPKGDLVSTGEDGSLVFWHQGKQRKKAQKIAKHHIGQLVFNNETPYFVSLDKTNGSMMWWNYTTATTVTEQPKSLLFNTIRSVHFSPNGKQVVTLDNEGHLHWWDGLTGRKKRQQAFTFSSHTIEALSFGHLSQQLISIGKEGSLVWWDTERSAPYLNDTTLNAGIDTNAMQQNAFKAVEQVFYSRNSEQRLSLSKTNHIEWAFRSKQKTRRGHLAWMDTRTLQKVYFSPKGRYLLLQDTQGEFLLWQTEQWRAHPFQPHFHPATRRVIFDREGRYLFSQDNNKRILQYKVATGEWVKNNFEYTANNAIKDIVISRDDRYSVIVSEANQLLWYRREDGELVNVEPAFVKNHEIQAIQFSPDSRYTVSVGKKGELVWWDTATGSLRFPMPPKKMAGHQVERIIFSPDSRQLVSLANDNSLVWWDTQTGAALSAPMRVHEELRDVVFHPEGKMMLSIGKEHMALWNSRSQKLLARQLRFNPFYEKYLTHAPDGTELAFRSSSGNLVFMAFPDNLLDALEEQACKIAGRNLSQQEWKTFIGQSSTNSSSTTQVQPYTKTCQQYPIGVERLKNVVLNIETGKEG